MSRVEELYKTMPRQVAWLCLKTLLHSFAVDMSGIGSEKLSIYKHSLGSLLSLKTNSEKQ
jgi:hypothetical protein